MYENGHDRDSFLCRFFCFTQDFSRPSSNQLSDFQRAFTLSLTWYTKYYLYLLVPVTIKPTIFICSHLVPLLKIWYTFHENFQDSISRFACFFQISGSQTPAICVTVVLQAGISSFYSFNGICYDWSRRMGLFLSSKLGFLEIEVSSLLAIVWNIEIPRVLLGLDSGAIFVVRVM